MATKKNQKQCLIWQKPKDEFEQDGQVFYYDDMDELSSALTVGYSNRPDLHELLEALENGIVKHGLVGKNTNGSKEVPHFASLADGDYFVGGVVDKNSVIDVLYIKDGDAPLYRSYMYCKLESVRPLTDEETENVRDKILEVLYEQDKVNAFNLFCILCCAKKVWCTTDASQTDKKWCSSDECYLSYDTCGLFTEDEVNAKKTKLSTVAHEAYKLMRALTGCDLVIKGKESLDFVSCLMNSRYLEPDQMEMVRGNPTITLKEVFQRVSDGKDRGDELDSAIKTCLSQVINGTNIKPSLMSGIFMDDCVSAKGMKVIEEQDMDLGGPNPEIFNGVEKCVFWKNRREVGAICKLYLWDETLTTFELVGGDLNAFAELIKSNK